MPTKKKETSKTKVVEKEPSKKPASKKPVAKKKTVAKKPVVKKVNPSTIKKSIEAPTITDFLASKKVNSTEQLPEIKEEVQRTVMPLVDAPIKNVRVLTVAGSIAPSVFDNTDEPAIVTMGCVDVTKAQRFFVAGTFK